MKRRSHVLFCGVYFLYFLHTNAWIDSETTQTFLQRRHDGKLLQLAMSDEFNVDNRGFGAGEDNIFEALEKPDDSNQAIQFYNSSREYVTTKNGSLVLSTRPIKTSWIEYNKDVLGPLKMTKNYTSGMIQTWNKFCFTGGILEMSIELPGDAYSGGLWPAAWLMGNLARATFPDTTVNMWPWSYDTCGEIDNLDTKQIVNACDGNPGFGFHPHQGRGAPEIDIFEVMPGHEMPHDGLVAPFMSCSLQVSPGIPKGPTRPVNGEKLNSNKTWYEGLHLGDGAEFNNGFWGQECGPEFDFSRGQVHKYMEDAISINKFLNDTHFERHHVYRLEWQPGPEGYLDWYLDDDFIFGIMGESLQELTGALIPEEPMYLILNTAISHRWGMPEPCDIANCPMCWRCYDCTNPECQCTLPEGMKNCKNMPAEMSIDFIRIYQDPEDPSHTLGCSPEGFPTTGYIDAHWGHFRSWEPYKGFFAVGDTPIKLTIRIIGVFVQLLVLAALVGFAIISIRSFVVKASSKGKREYSTVPGEDWPEDTPRGPARDLMVTVEMTAQPPTIPPNMTDSYQRGS